MITQKIQTLASLREKVSELEKAIGHELSKELAVLPAKYGFDNAEGFIKAVKAATGSQNLTAGKRAGRAKRKRAVVTPEIKANVISLVKAGKTGSEIARTVGISLPSVYNLKKAVGLVGKRSDFKTKRQAAGKGGGGAVGARAKMAPRGGDGPGH